MCEDVSWSFVRVYLECDVLLSKYVAVSGVN